MKQQPVAPEKIVTAREAAALLNISYMTFTRRVRDGLIHPIDPPNPALKRQRNLRFRVSDVEKLKGGS